MGTRRSVMFPRDGSQNRDPSRSSGRARHPAQVIDFRSRAWPPIVRSAFGESCGGATVSAPNGPELLIVLWRPSSAKKLIGPGFGATLDKPQVLRLRAARSAQDDKSLRKTQVSRANSAPAEPGAPGYPKLAPRRLP